MRSLVRWLSSCSLCCRLSRCLSRSLGSGLSGSLSLGRCLVCSSLLRKLGVHEADHLLEGSESGKSLTCDILLGNLESLARGDRGEL